MKTKLKKLSYWAGVSAVGIVLGISLQFVRAWVEPTVAPPGGNIGAPINTGGSTQLKKGYLGVGDNSTAGVPNFLLTTTGTATGIGTTQHSIFGPYDAAGGDQGSLYIGVGRSAGKSGDNRNNFIVYNHGCSGGNCKVPSIALHADYTYMGGDVRAEGSIHSTSGGFRFPDGTLQTTAAGSPNCQVCIKYYKKAGGCASGTTTSQSNVSGYPYQYEICSLAGGTESNAAFMSDGTGWCTMQTVRLVCS